MPIVNDYPGAWEAIRGEGERLGRAVGIQPEVFWGFFNDYGRFPTDLDELNAWGSRPDRIYGIVRRTPDGVWHPITQGMQTPGKTDQDRAGFMGAGGQTGHMINNAEDSDVQRFKDFDPGILQRIGRTTVGPSRASASSGQGAVARSAQVSFDQDNYVAPSPNGQFVAVVGGNAVYFNTQAEAEQNFNQRTGGTAPAPAPAGAPGGGGGGGSPAAGGAPAGGGTGGGQLTNPAVDRILLDLANNAAQIAYQNKRLELDRDIANRLDEREKQRIALEAARDAANAVTERARLTGTYPDGTPTLDARKTAADITGYQPGAGQGAGAAVESAMNALRADPSYLALDGAGRRAREAAALQQTVPGLNAQQAAAAIDRMRALTAQTNGTMSSTALIEGVLNQVAPGAATFQREQEQNRTTLDAIGILSKLRGPENAFAYNSTLASLPPSIRAQIQAAMGRLPLSPQNPAQRGLFGDLGIGGPTAVGQPVMAQDPMAAAQARVAAVTTPPVAPGVPGAPAPAASAQSAPGAATTPAPGAQPSAAAIGQTFGLPAQPNPLTSLPIMSRPGGPVQAQAGGMVAPHRLAAADVTHANPYTQKILWAGYENQGQDPEAARWEFLHALPIASGAKTARVRV